MKRSLKLMSPWINRDPFSIFNELVGASIAPMSSDDDTYTSILPLNLEEKEDRYIVTVHVPGIPAENIDISLNNNVLTISAHYKEENEENSKYHIREIYESSFVRSIVLPGKVNEEKIEASCKDGVLKVILPKYQQDNIKKIKINS